MEINCPVKNKTADARTERLTLPDSNLEPANSWSYPHHRLKMLRPLEF